MILRRMELRNFRVHRDTTIDFESGLTAIVGANESGKSSVLEALTWAIYGGPGVRGSVKTLRWRNAPARNLASVEVTLTLGDTDYIVRRTETTAKVHSRLRGDDEWAQVADGTSGVTQYMTQRIGMTLQEFSASYLCSQKDVARLAAMKPVERQTFIRRIMGAERLDGAVADARKAARDAASELRGMETLLGDGTEHEGVLELAKAEMEHRIKVRDDAIVSRDEAQYFLTQYVTECDEFDELRRRHVSATEKIDNIRAWIRESQRSRKTFLEMQTNAQAEVEEMDRLDKELEGFDSIEFLLGSLDEAEKLIEQVKFQRAQLDQANQRIDGLIKKIETEEAIVDAYDPAAIEVAGSKLEELNNRLRRVQLERHEASAKLQARIREAEKVRDAMSKAAGSGICPSCAQPLKSLEEVEATKAHAQREILAAEDELAGAREASEGERQAIIDRRTAQEEAHKANMRMVRAQDAEQRLARGRSELETAKGERDGVQRRIGNIESQGAVRGYDPEEHKRVRAQQRAMEQKYHRRTALRNSKFDLERANDRLQNIENRLGKFAKEQLEAEAALEAVTYDPEHHKAATSIKKDAQATLEEKRRAMVEADKQVAVMEREVAAAQRALEDHRAKEAQIRKIREEVAFHEQVRDRLQEFRSTVLDSVKPDLAELVSGMLAGLTDGRHESVEVDDTFGIVLYEDGMESQVVSGGTEDIAALAMRIALSQLIAERSGGMDILILDEPFGSLDATRRANTASLLQQVADVFPQVILISHVSETRHIGDHVVQLEYDHLSGATKVL